MGIQSRAAFPSIRSSKTFKMIHKIRIFLVFSFTFSQALATNSEVNNPEEVSDPRVFFANITSGMVAVNYTLLTYAGIIVIGGSFLGLALYFLASSARERYSHNQYHHDQYANSRMGISAGADDFDLIGLLTTAMEVYQKLNSEEED